SSSSRGWECASFAAAQATSRTISAKSPCAISNRRRRQADAARRRLERAGEAGAEALALDRAGDRGGGGTGHRDRARLTTARRLEVADARADRPAARGKG